MVGVDSGDRRRHTSRLLTYTIPGQCAQPWLGPNCSPGVRRDSCWSCSMSCPPSFPDCTSRLDSGGGHFLGTGVLVGLFVIQNLPGTVFAGYFLFGAIVAAVQWPLSRRE